MASAEAEDGQLSPRASLNHGKPLHPGTANRPAVQAYADEAILIDEEVDCAFTVADKHPLPTVVVEDMSGEMELLPMKSAMSSRRPRSPSTYVPDVDDTGSFPPPSGKRRMSRDVTPRRKVFSCMMCLLMMMITNAC